MRAITPSQAPKAFATRLRDLADRVERDGLDNASFTEDERRSFEPLTLLAPRKLRRFTRVTVLLEIPIKAKRKKAKR